MIRVILSFISLFAGFSGEWQNDGSVTNDRTLAFVSGKIVDERSFPVPYAKVIIGGIEVQADVSGRFNFSQVGYPYDVMIAERYTSTAAMYMDLTVTDPELVLFGKPDYRNYNTAGLKVTIPPLGDTSEAFVSFISREISDCKTAVASRKTESVNLKVDFPAANTNIRGDVVMAVKNPSSYSFYRKKNVYLSNGTKNNEVILPSKPESKTGVTDTKIYSGLQDYYQSEINVAIDFRDYSRNSNLTILELDGKRKGNIESLPLKLPYSSRLKVSGFAETRAGSKFTSYFFATPKSDFKVPEEFLPELVVPSDGYAGVTGNTEFRYTVGSGAGIYVLEFRSRNPEMRFFLVTDETYARLTILNRPEISNARNIVFDWRVRKYLTYFSVDEFVRPNVFKNELGYKGVLYSTGRSFRTSYF